MCTNQFILCLFTLVLLLKEGHGSLDESFSLGRASNCSCDLSASKCDTRCCCDPDCDEVSLASFNSSCLPGLAGGEDLGLHTFQNCSRNSSLWDPALHSLLCIQTDNTAYLGHFHEMVPSLDSIHMVDQLELGPEYRRYRDIEVVETNDNMTGHYRAGRPVRTLYDKEEGVTGSLSLPVISLHGGCVPGPVRFLRPRTSVCSVPISAEICSSAKNTGLDHQMFLMTSAGVSLAPNFPQVLAVNNALNTSVTETRYHFTEDVGHYLSVSSPSLKSQPQPTDLSSLMKTLRSNRGRDPASLFSSGNTMPYGMVHSVAHFDPDTGLCNNIVLEVRYEVIWAGVQIKKVKADVLLTNISLVDLKQNNVMPNVSLQQHFKAFFTHSAKSQEKMLLRSGNPGYNLGSPVVFVKKVEDGTNKTFELDAEGFRVWGDNSYNSQCSENTLETVKFGQNSLTGCYVRIEREMLSECEDLEKRISRIQDTLIQSTFVSKSGDLNLTLTENFVRILSENISETNPRTEERLGPNCLVPAKLKITFLTITLNTPVGRISKINGLKVSKVYQEWTWPKCKWKMTGSEGCRDPQSFLLTSQVEFLEIPNVWHHQNTTKFWLKQDSLKCGGDVCWEDLGSPLGSLATGDQLAEVMQWTLSLGALIPPTLYFSRLKL